MRPNENPHVPDDLVEAHHAPCLALRDRAHNQTRDGGLGRPESDPEDAHHDGRLPQGRMKKPKKIADPATMKQPTANRQRIPM
jgi:hypothetical protein